MNVIWANSCAISTEEKNKRCKIRYNFHRPIRFSIGFPRFFSMKACVCACVLNKNILTVIYVTRHFSFLCNVPSVHSLWLHVTLYAINNNNNKTRTKMDDEYTLIQIEYCFWEVHIAHSISLLGIVWWPTKPIAFAVYISISKFSFAARVHTLTCNYSALLNIEMVKSRGITLHCNIANESPFSQHYQRILECVNIFSVQKSFTLLFIVVIAFVFQS